jgi:hypothetical protein
MGLVSPPQRLVFCAAPEDADLRERLDAHLSLLERNGLISTWHEGMVAPGQDRQAQVLTELLRADIILLLISASFLESDECYERLMKPALARHAQGEALVIPLLVRPVDWEGAPFAPLACLPQNLLPVTMWRSVDEALLDIEKGLRRALAARAQGLPFSADAPPTDPGLSPTQERVLDAAVPSAVIVGELTEVLAMVTTAGSGGLRALITLTPQDFSVSPGEVKSTHFELEFPVDAQGRPRALTVTVTLESPDFDPPSLRKKLLVPPRADSTVCTLLVKPRRSGRLALQMELQKEDVTIWSQRLLTTGAAPGAAVQAGYLLTSVPLSTVVHAGTQSLPAPPPADDATAGEEPQGVLFSMQELLKLEEARRLDEEISREKLRRADDEQRRWALEQMQREQEHRRAAELGLKRTEVGGYGPPPAGPVSHNPPPNDPGGYGGPPTRPPVTSPSGLPVEPPVKVAPKWPNEDTLTKIIVEHEHQLVVLKPPAPSRRLLWTSAALLLLLAGAALLYFFTAR